MLHNERTIVILLSSVFFIVVQKKKAYLLVCGCKSPFLRSIEGCSHTVLLNVQSVKFFPKFFPETFCNSVNCELQRSHRQSDSHMT